MIVENKNIEKYCSFYISDFHLEMILVPYINNKIENNEEVKIITEKDLRDTIQILISRMNLKEENKNKILNLNWNKNIESESIKEKSNIIIIGKEDYIEKENIKIESLQISNITITDCYNFEEVKDNMEDIVIKYSKSLNTMGFDNF